MAGKVDTLWMIELHCDHHSAAAPLSESTRCLMGIAEGKGDRPMAPSNNQATREN